MNREQIILAVVCLIVVLIMIYWPQVSVHINQECTKCTKNIFLDIEEDKYGKTLYQYRCSCMDGGWATSPLAAKKMYDAKIASIQERLS